MTSVTLSHIACSLSWPLTVKICVVWDKVFCHTLISNGEHLIRVNLVILTLMQTLCQREHEYVLSVRYSPVVLKKSMHINVHFGKCLHYLTPDDVLTHDDKSCSYINVIFWTKAINLFFQIFNLTISFYYYDVCWKLCVINRWWIPMLKATRCVFMQR